MTAVAVICPSWCTQASATQAPPCLEHYSDTQYVPATAGRPMELDGLNGATFPMVGVAVVFSQHPDTEDPAPFIGVSATGIGRDLDLRVSEARELARLLLEAVDIATT